MIAIDVLENAFNKTKETFWPIRWGYWLKMTLVFMLISGASSGSRFSNEIPSEGPIDLFSFLTEYLWIILLVVGFLMLVGLAWSVIVNILKFVFVEGIVKKDLLFWKMFKRNANKGVSFFLFQLMVGMINLAIILALAIPLIVPVYNNWYNLSWDVISIPYLVLFIILFIIDVILMGLFMLINEEMMLYDMFISNKSPLVSFRRMLAVIKKNKLECFMYLLLLIGLGMAFAMITIVLAIILAIPFFFLGLFIVIPLVAIASANVTLIFVMIVLGVFIAVIMLIVYSFLISAVTLPIKGFLTIFSYDFIDKLTKKMVMMRKR